MIPAKPSLELLRSLTDEHVLRSLIAERRLTRAEIAARTGISKPTIGESVRRLTEAGLVRDTGERTTGRGRVGSYYALTEGLGVALVAGIAPEGVIAEAVDVYGDVLARETEEVVRPARPDQLAKALQSAATRALSATGRPARLAVVSAADPVDRQTGRLVQLPYAPFLIGELSPAEVLEPLVKGPVTVDNDVNWAAAIERAHADRGVFDDFGYLYLGEGLGCAVVADGQVRRGTAGIAGEIAHVITTGANGRAMPFINVFADLGLLQPGSTAIDVIGLLARVEADSGEADRSRTTLGEAISGVIVAIVALTDPQLVVLGGSWGAHPRIRQAVIESLGRQPRAVPVRSPQVVDEPSLAGARQRAWDDLQTLLTRPADVAGRVRTRSQDQALSQDQARS